MQIRDHRQKYLPTMSAELKRRGQFHQAVCEAQELVGETLYRLEVKERFPHDRAWDVTGQLASFRNEQDRLEQPNRLWTSPRAWPRVRLSAETGEYLPTMSAELKRRGQFHQAVCEARQLVGETLYRLEVKERLPHDRAWDVARQLASFRNEQDRPEHPNRLWTSPRAWPRVRLSAEKGELRLQRGQLPPRQNSSPAERPTAEPVSAEPSVLSAHDGRLGGAELVGCAETTRTSSRPSPPRTSVRWNWRQYFCMYVAR